MQTRLCQSNLQLQSALPRFLGLCLLSACLLLDGTGCKKGADSNATINPTGVYALVSVGGKSLPCSLSHEGTLLTIRSGVFIITPDSRCVSRIAFSLPDQKDMNREVKATYTRQGAELTMQWEGAGMTMGHIGGSTFTMTNEGTVFAYRK
ncbi:MAG TPA: hypothetical protein VMA35_04890 [Candidatus Sulfopaludibacter sp.]|nr:hypothetical protein [Candidatus Sulfopaludibacter sp.]